ncbi:hypothetical protein M422DRAFT_66719 [Sphaerobolus stellatus SS14]|uniref:AAA+ ATPase domain-containing protein n=1 Tax=Sphaerobolus stellatus (strain SS14) TaxID=990650 RepID=A0A0C9VHI3_SPHS4|nr:hypothetical protein M422DRAFT_66719 [Sphaerobolus stellatus SS14]
MPTRKSSSKIYGEPDPISPIDATNGVETGETSNATGPVGALCELITLDHRYDKKGKFILVPKVESPEEKQRSKFTEYALVFRRIFNNKHELIHTRVDINSVPILQVLSEIVKYYPAHPEIFQEVLVVESPFMVLYHHWDQLKDYRDETDDDETRMHLNFLLDFMNRELGEDSKNADRLIETVNISFALLWTIFRPGDLILDRTDRDHQRLWRLVGLEYGQNSNGRYLSLDLSCTNYDGEDTGRESDTRILSESAVGKASLITRLAMYPIRFAKNQEEIMKKITERGEKFLSLRGIHIRRYKGQLEMLRRPPLDFFSSRMGDYTGTFTPYNIEGRIIVDTNTFGEENSAYRPELYEWNEQEEEVFDMLPAHSIEFWKSVDPQLCPPYVHGYCPSIKQWCRFYIDRLEEPRWNPDSFDDLILPDAPKRVIRSLVRAHQYPEESIRDQQELKGKGLVVLLHGTPGTGKTLTAESVSEYTKRPLLVISSGELGTKVAEIDKNLSTFLQYAAMWKAIVLIDEADVFLEARLTGVSNRLEQNSLVAVFLRQLEYFQGIVFLTSNRGSGFDPAIKSRIHLFLQFAPPDVKTRQTLWNLRLSKLNPEERNFDPEEALRIVRDVSMNGREISNALNTIRTLAREEGKKISLEHFQAFIQVWECFDDDDQEGKGQIGRGGKDMRSDKLKEACAECGCTCKDSTILVRKGSLL